MSNRPNVLLLFTDQQRADTIGALGNPIIRTPNLDRICREGTAFTSAYSPAPECVPGRCSMQYAQYPHHTGCYANGFPMPEDGRQSWVGALAEAGYRTHAIGKRHFSPDPTAGRGYQTIESQEEGVSKRENDDYMTYLAANGGDHLTDPHGVRGEMYYIPQPAQMPARLHPTQWVGDRATAFIEDAAGKAEPWMLYSSFIHPHPPFAPPTPWHKLYRAPLMPLPHMPQDHESLWTWINRFQNRYKYRDQGLDQNLLRNIIAYYYGCISFIDFQIGRILASLEATGQLDNTLILYSSDHGELLGDYACFGKRSMHDACARIPMLARLPGRFAAGAVCNTPVSLVDIGTTALAATGAPTTETQLDGADMAAIADGSDPRDGVLMQYQTGGKGLYSLVTKRWKYTWSAGDQKEFLFDRVNDPRETRNRANAPFMKDAARGMKAALIAELTDTSDLLHPAVDGNTWREFELIPPPDPDDPDAGLLIQDAPWADLSIPGYTD